MHSPAKKICLIISNDESRSKIRVNYIVLVFIKARVDRVAVRIEAKNKLVFVEASVTEAGLHRKICLNKVADHKIVCVHPIQMEFVECSLTTLVVIELDAEPAGQKF